MFSFKKRLVLAIVSIVGFCLFTYGILSLPEFISRESEPLRNYRNVLLFLLNLIIILGWISMGAAGGFLLLVCASLLALFLAARSGVFGYSLYLLLYVGSGVVVTSCLRRIRWANRVDEVELENLEEATSSLTMEAGRLAEETQGLRKRFQRYVTLKGVTETLGTRLSLEEVTRLVVTKTLEIIGKGESCLLFLVDRAMGKLIIVAEEPPKGLETEVDRKGDILDQRVIRQRQPLLITDIQKDFRFSLDEHLKTWRSLIIAPVVSKERVIGLLRINSSAPDTFTSDDLRLLDIISGLASVAIENALLYQRTQELAIKDGLTGLYVHRYFYQRLQEEQERAEAKGEKLSILMCDLDHFKNYNDRYGHTAGDILLRRIAEILVGEAGEDSVVTRYGGEEFAIILPGMDKDGALEIARRLCKKVSGEIFPIRRASTKITISIGVVSYPYDGLSPEDLVKKADQAMYRAKQEGRDRVCTV